MMVERTQYGLNFIFQFPDMVSKVEDAGLNSNDDAQQIVKMFLEAEHEK